MSNDAVTKPAHESKDMDRAIKKATNSEFAGMSFMVVKAGVVLTAAYSLNEARSLARFHHAAVKSIDNKVLFIAA